MGTEREQINTSMIQVEAVTKGLQKALKQVGGRMDRQDTLQPRHEQVNSHIHETIVSEGVVVMSWDERLGQELLNIKAQHEWELQN